MPVCAGVIAVMIGFALITAIHFTAQLCTATVHNGIKRFFMNSRHRYAMFFQIVSAMPFKDFLY
jgi:Flp pilus assembly pilin Flp